MLRAKAHVGERITLLIGLTAANLRRLQSGQPIYFGGHSVGIEHDVALVVGTDEAELLTRFGAGVAPLVQALHKAGFSVYYRDAQITRDINDQAPARWLIWSNEHEAWWRANRVGYTHQPDEAGRYPGEQARAICAEAGLVKGRFGATIPAELMVPAPEDLP